MADTPESTKDFTGRVKEAAGNVTGDKDLQREGKIDQAGEKVKSGIDKLADEAQKVLHNDK